MVSWGKGHLLSSLSDTSVLPLSKWLAAQIMDGLIRRRPESSAQVARPLQSENQTPSSSSSSWRYPVVFLRKRCAARGAKIARMTPDQIRAASIG